MHILFTWKRSQCGSYEHAHHIPPPFPRTNSAVWKKSLLGLARNMAAHLSFLGFPSLTEFNLWTKTHTSSSHFRHFSCQYVYINWGGSPFSVIATGCQCISFLLWQPALHAKDHFVRCSIFRSCWKAPMSSRMLHPSMIWSHLCSTEMNPFTLTRLSEWQCN